MKGWKTNERVEIESALELGLPIIVTNLNNMTVMDPDRCPPLLRAACAIHVPFKKEAIKYALENFPQSFRRMNGTKIWGSRRPILAAAGRLLQPS